MESKGEREREREKIDEIGVGKKQRQGKLQQ